MGLLKTVPWPVLLIGMAIVAHGLYHYHSTSRRRSFLKQHSTHTKASTSTAETPLAPTLDLKFHKFLDLPLELRLQIYQLALPGPRVIEIRNLFAGFSKLCPVTGSAGNTRISSICHIPALLHICRESRLEALRHYELSLGTNHFPAQIFIDFSKDIVYFGPEADFYFPKPIRHRGRFGQVIPIESGLDIIRSEDLEKIQFLALKIRYFDRLQKVRLERFKNLEGVLCVRRHIFGLDSEPVLGTEESGILFGEEPELLHHLESIVRQEPDWKMPVFKRGLFVSR